MSSLSQAMMRRPPQDQRLPPSSYDHLADTWIQAISKYERDTGVKLLDPSIASFDSADKIVAYVEEQEQQFLQFRASGHPRLRERIEPIATIVSRLCDCLGEAVISPVSPVRVIFASFKVAVETAVKLKEDYDAIVDAFDSIKFYLDFLEPVTGSRYYEKLHAPTVELLAHVLVVIGVVTKTRRDRRFKGWWKKLCGNKDVAVAMAKLQDLALKQHHAMSAMTLHGVEQNTALLQGGFSSTIREQEIQRRHLTHIEYQIQEVAHRTMFSAVNYVQIDVGVLEDMQLALLVQSFQTFEAIYRRAIFAPPHHWSLFEPALLQLRYDCPRRAARWFLDGMPFASFKKGDIQMLVLHDADPGYARMVLLLTAVRDLGASCASQDHPGVLLHHIYSNNLSELLYHLLCQAFCHLKDPMPASLRGVLGSDKHLLENELLDVLHELLNLLPQRIYIVVHIYIDAEDPQDFDDTLDALHGLCSSHSNVRVLCGTWTSHFGAPPSRDVLSCHTNISATVLNLRASHGIQKDIELIIDDVAEEGLLGHIRDFALVRETLSVLKEGKEDYQSIRHELYCLRRLGELPVDMLQHVHNVVNALRELYLHFTDRHSHQDQGKTKWAIILTWLATTSLSPSRAELAELLLLDLREQVSDSSSTFGIDVGDVLSFLCTCRDEDHAKILHYIRDNPWAHKFRYSVAGAEHDFAYHLLARTCINIISSVGPGTSSEAEQMKSALYLHAEDNWMSYVEKVDLSSHPDLEQDIIDLIELYDGRDLPGFPPSFKFWDNLPLHRVADYACPQLVRIYLDRGADVNATDADGQTPLRLVAGMWACSEPEFYIMRLLVERGANINSADALGQTPLHIAYYFGAKSNVRWLLSLGADPDIRNNWGQTPYELGRERAIRKIWPRLVPEDEGFHHEMRGRRKFGWGTRSVVHM